MIMSLGGLLALPKVLGDFFRLTLTVKTPKVHRLRVHLPGHHMVVFNEDDDPAEVAERAANEKTELTTFFEAICDEGPLGDLAREHTYSDFPEYFTCLEHPDEGPKRWKIRCQCRIFGRMYMAGPNEGERFYLRTLLGIV
jgi:hypothetical protein